LQALLDDVFCVFSDTSEASRNGKNPSLVTLDENFKCVSISTFGSNDEPLLRPGPRYSVAANPQAGVTHGIAFLCPVRVFAPIASLAIVLLSVSKVSR